MRDYLYLWHDRKSKRLVVSGIEFRDFVPNLRTTSGIVLLRHQYSDTSLDTASRFEFVPADEIVRLAAEDIYGYGDFCWADFDRKAALTDLSDQAIAELNFFAHMARPLGGVVIPGLGNHFLCFSHDDGWYARIFYHRWDAVAPLLHRLLRGLMGEAQSLRTLDQVSRGNDAFWCTRGTLIQCEQTENIDGLQQKYLITQRFARGRPGRKTRGSRGK